MIELREILHRLRVGQSIKAIKQELAKPKTVIRKVKQIAEQEGWLNSEVALLSEYDIQLVFEAE